MSRLIFAFLVTALVGLSHARGETSLAGDYESYASLDFRTIVLREDGVYSARWDLDIAPGHGVARGRWRSEGDHRVVLTPENEEGGLKGFYRVLEVREFEGKRALIRAEDLVDEHNPYRYLFLKKKKAAEPGATDNPDDAQRLREDH